MAGPRLSSKLVSMSLIQADQANGFSAFTTAFPTKVGIQIHPAPWQGFTWAPTFVGETEEEQADAGSSDPNFR